MCGLEYGILSTNICTGCKTEPADKTGSKVLPGEVVLSSTRKGSSAGVVGLHVGMTLTLIHLISIPVDNTSVNPACSFGVAIFAAGDALEQLWAFVVFPVIGAIVGVLAWLAISEESLEDTALGGTVLTDIRDQASRATDQIGKGLGSAWRIRLIRSASRGTASPWGARSP